MFLTFQFQAINLVQTVQVKFQAMTEQILNKINQMGTRIDELEKSIDISNENPQGDLPK